MVQLEDARRVITAAEKKARDIGQPIEARGHGEARVVGAPVTVVISLMAITRAPGAIGIPGLYVTERLPIAKIVNATVIPLDEAPGGYRDFDAGAPRKYVLDRHGLLKGKHV